MTSQLDGASMPERVAQFLADSFQRGVPRRLTRTARGAMGTVWRLEVDGPTGPISYAAKQLFWEVPLERVVAAEVAFTDRCREAGVPCPEAMPDPDGCYLVVDPVRGDTWRMYEWVDGEVPADSDLEATEWLAVQMARIHALDLPNPDPAVAIDPWYLRSETQWQWLTSEAESIGADWAPFLRKRTPDLDAFRGLVNAQSVGEGVLCHRDLKTNNVLRDGSRGWLWLVDWENAGPMEPWRELGALLLGHIAEPAVVARITAAYESAGGPARITGPEGMATGLAVWLNFLTHMVGVLLDPEAGEEHRAFARPRVIGLLRTMPTPAELERLFRV